MNIRTLTFGLLLTFLAACGSKQVAMTEQNSSVTKNDILAIKTDWIKDKGKKYDLEIRVTNISKNDIIIMLNDISCMKGSTTGTLKHTFFNTGERTIDFRKGQMKQFRMVCNLGMNAIGPYKIAISRIYDNPNGDGATKGKEIGQGVDWTGEAN